VLLSKEREYFTQRPTTGRTHQGLHHEEPDRWREVT
jgi:hypothetical protein